MELIKRKIGEIKENSNKHLKMKGLTIFIIVNLLCLFVISYLVTIKVTHYSTISRSFIPLLICNVIVGGTICIKGYYKKNITHIFMALILIFRYNIHNICSKQI